VTLFGLFLTPVFYVVIRGWVERTGRSRAAPLALARATPEIAE
jgi:hypothetical protein